MRPQLHQVLDHTVGLVELTGHYLESLKMTHDNYLARVGIDLTETSNDVSRGMIRITLFAMIMLPMNMISAIMGMNTPVRLAHWPRAPGERLRRMRCRFHS